MAKTKEKADKGEAKAEKKEYTVADLAEAMGKETFEVRALLRKAGVDKTDGKYSWTKKSEFEGVLKQISGGGKKDKAEKAAPENKSEGKKGEKQRPKPGGKK